MRDKSALPMLQLPPNTLKAAPPAAQVAAVNERRKESERQALRGGGKRHSTDRSGAGYRPRQIEDADDRVFDVDSSDGDSVVDVGVPLATAAAAPRARERLRSVQQQQQQQQQRQQRQMLSDSASTIDTLMRQSTASALPKAEADAGNERADNLRREQGDEYDLRRKALLTKLGDHVLAEDSTDTESKGRTHSSLKSAPSTVTTAVQTLAPRTLANSSVQTAELPWQQQQQQHQQQQQQHKTLEHSETTTATEIMRKLAHVEEIGVQTSIDLQERLHNKGASTQTEPALLPGEHLPSAHLGLDHAMNFAGAVHRGDKNLDNNNNNNNNNNSNNNHDNLNDTTTTSRDQSILTRMNGFELDDELLDAILQSASRRGKGDNNGSNNSKPMRAADAAAAAAAASPFPFVLPNLLEVNPATAANRNFINVVDVEVDGYGPGDAAKKVNARPASPTTTTTAATTAAAAAAISAAPTGNSERAAQRTQPRARFAFSVKDNLFASDAESERESPKPQPLVPEVPATRWVCLFAYVCFVEVEVKVGERRMYTACFFVFFFIIICFFKKK